MEVPRACPWGSISVKMPAMKRLNAITDVPGIQVAKIAHSGLAKVISPLHTTFDGDLVFAISLGGKKADVNTFGLLGEAALMQSVKRAVIKADGFGVIPSYKDLAV